MAKNSQLQKSVCGCGRTFLKTKKSRKYCGASCRNNAAQKRLRDRAREFTQLQEAQGA